MKDRARQAPLDQHISHFEKDSALDARHINLPEIMYGWRVKCIRKKLQQLGKEKGPLTVAELTSLGHLDQYHYLETKACDEAISRLSINATHHVLDLGSGIGGPARYMAYHTQAKFTCIEVQADLNSMTKELTERVGLGQYITYLTGDISEISIPDDTFDAFVSFLVFLHIPHKKRLFSNCYKSLKPGSSFLIEDMIELSPFTDHEQMCLHNMVSASGVIPLKQYLNQLQGVGFKELAVEHLTDPWRDWCNKRYKDFVNDQSNISLYGDEVYQSRVKFYETIKNLFNGGNLGGVRITGQKPSSN